MDRPGRATAPAGITAPSLERWLAEHLPSVALPCRYEPISGGNSNLTYLVVDSDGRRMVLRRPPLNSVIATAHDMGREWRAISALGDTAVPVPPALAFCDDARVIGAPFYLTGFVDGHVLHDIGDALDSLTPADRATTGPAMIRALTELHRVDPDAVGLGDHGRRDGNYVERQLRRWHQQYAQTQTETIPDIEAAYVRLLAAVPPTHEARVVHGDYRLGNCIVTGDGGIAAVLDWEISTLGDPLADLAYLLSTWARPGNTIGGLTGAQRSPSMAEGFAETDDLLALYAELSGRDVSRIAYYLAFNHWRYACIAQGVRSRHLRGAMGDDISADLDEMATNVRERAALASAALDAVAARE